MNISHEELTQVSGDISSQIEEKLKIESMKRQISEIFFEQLKLWNEIRDIKEQLNNMK